MQQVINIMVLDKNTKEPIMLQESDGSKTYMCYDSYDDMMRTIFNNDPEFYEQFADSDGFLECRAEIFDSESHRYLHSYLKVGFRITPNE